MKLSAFILSAMSVAVLSSCQEKVRQEVKPNKEQTKQTDGKGQPSTKESDNSCPACGMG